MSINKNKMLQSMVRSFRESVISEAQDRHKHVSLTLAIHYNSLREKVAEFHEVKEHLPPAINLQTPFARMGMTVEDYAGLLVFLNQLVTITDILVDE